MKNHTVLPVGHNNMHLYQMMEQRDVCACMLYSLCLFLEKKKYWLHSNLHSFIHLKYVLYVIC